MLRMGRVPILLDSAHEGPPLATEINFDDPLNVRPCESMSHPIMVGDKKFGNDTTCFSQKLFRAHHGEHFMVLGLHSLKAERLLIDTRKSQICW
jgi:hypothetical protein